MRFTIWKIVPFGIFKISKDLILKQLHEDLMILPFYSIFIFFKQIS